MIGEIAFLVLYGLVIIIWVTRHFEINRNVRDWVCLTRQSPQDVPNPTPLVSVIIPARDEEETIAACVEAMRRQTYPNLEVLVADDRSEDRTAEIVAELAQQDDRVRLIRITELPAGWTGKTHALATAVEQAKGEFLLFIDADTTHEPENVSVCMHRLLADGADMLTLLPQMRNETFWEHVVQPLASICLMMWFPLRRVNDPDDKMAFGNGQYILIRRSAYEAVGGHEAVKDALLEDIALARRIKHGGHRLLVASAPEISATRMYTSLAGIIRGWSRIYFAGLGPRLIRIFRSMLMMWVFSFLAYIVLAAGVALVATGETGWFVWTIVGMALAHLAAKFSVMSRLYRLARNRCAYLPLYLLSAVVVHVAQWSAMIKVFTGRVTWRGTDYRQKG